MGTPKHWVWDCSCPSCSHTTGNSQFPPTPRWELSSNCFLWQDCHFANGTNAATGKINPSKWDCWLYLVIWTAIFFLFFNQLQILVFAGFGLVFLLTSVFTKLIYELGVYGLQKHLQYLASKFSYTWGACNCLVTSSQFSRVQHPLNSDNQGMTRHAMLPTMGISAIGHLSHWASKLRSHSRVWVRELMFGEWMQYSK